LCDVLFFAFLNPLNIYSTWRMCKDQVRNRFALLSQCIFVPKLIHYSTVISPTFPWLSSTTQSKPLHLFLNFCTTSFLYIELSFTSEQTRKYNSQKNFSLQFLEWNSIPYELVLSINIYEWFVVITEGCNSDRFLQCSRNSVFV
jgi:hypothetical protein